ncbi:unnamed protein product [Tenebrio molitor]|nr:unnamed protein product [Tenebrio molitor]
MAVNKQIINMYAKMMFVLVMLVAIIATTVSASSSPYTTREPLICTTDCTHDWYVKNS